MSKSKQKSKPLVAIDANVIVWGVRDINKKGRSKEDRQRSEQCKWLFWHLREDNAKIIVPAIAATEVLRGIAPDKHLKFMDELRKFFVIAPFDLKASTIAGKLWHERLQKLPDHDDPNVKMKADIFIVASAKAANAGAFYSHDKGALKIAKLTMNAFNLPTTAPSLFEMGD